MLQRVEDRDKSKLQVVVTDETIKRIKIMAAELYKTQSKFLSDLVDAAWAARVAVLER